MGIFPKAMGFIYSSPEVRVVEHPPKRLSKSHEWSTIELEASVLESETCAVVLCTRADCQMSARAVIADRAPR